MKLKDIVKLKKGKPKVVFAVRVREETKEYLIKNNICLDRIVELLKREELK